MIDIWHRLRRKLKYSRRFLIYCFGRFFIWMLALLPRSVAFPLGRSVGYIGFFAFRKERKRALKHLDFALGDELDYAERNRIAKKMCENFGLLLAEAVFMLAGKKEDLLPRIIDVEGKTKKTIGQALEKGRGAIIYTAHMGNWELAGGWVASHFPFAVVARRIYYEKFNEVMILLRNSYGAETLYQRESPRKILRALRDNKALAVVADQHLRRTPGMYIPFFGHLTKTINGPVALSLLSKAPIIPAVIVRGHQGEDYRIYCEDPLIPDRKKDRDLAIYETNVKLNQFLEKYIRRFPHQWVWNHRRWRTGRKGPSVEDLQLAEKMLTRLGLATDYPELKILQK